MFEWWQLTPTDADRFWHALETSRYSRPTTLRHQLALPGTMAVDMHHFVAQVLTPTVAIGVTEDLVHEQRLARPLPTGFKPPCLSKSMGMGHGNNLPEKGPSDGCGNRTKRPNRRRAPRAVLRTSGRI